MIRRSQNVFGLSCLLSLSLLASVVSAESPRDASKPDDGVAAIREQAKLLHDVYAATLDVVHERYFRNDRSTIPARALEDVFQEIHRQRKIQARWIGVNARTMSINHEPKEGFEKDAALAIREGKSEYESVDDHYYRRATPIPLTSGCLTCHGSFGFEPKTPRYAGLVIQIPLPKTDRPN